MCFWSVSTVDTNLGNNVMGSDNKLWRFRPDAVVIGDFYEVLLPAGLQGLDARHSTHVYNDFCYSVGSFSSNLMLDKQYRALRQGILPWGGVPAVVAAAGPGPTGSCRCAYAFWDENTLEWSPLSAFTAAFNLANQKRAWTDIPVVGPEDEFQAAGTTTANATTAIVGIGTRFTTELRIGDQISLSSAAGTYATVIAIASDTALTVSANLGNGTSQRINVRRLPRWTHVGLVVEMDDALPRVAMKVQLGTTSVTEGVATLALGEAFTTTFTRMPRGTISAIFHERQWVADYTDTVTASDLFFPERSAGVAVRTNNGEPVIALLNVSNDVLLAFTPVNTYAIRGYTAADVEIKLVDAENGALNHWLNLVIFGRAYVPHKNGVNMWNGANHSMSEDIRNLWIRESKAHETEYQNGFAVHDPDRRSLEAYVSGSVSFPELPDPGGVVPQAVGWVMQYDGVVSEAGGGFSQPDWMFDVSGRSVHSAALLFKPGARRGDVYFGGCDGFIRKRDSVNTNDDGDTYSKRWAVRSRAECMNDPGGDIQEGKSFDRMWSLMETEANAADVYFIGGDETAWKATLPDNATQFWTDNIPATSLIGQIGDDGFVYDYVPLTVHPHAPTRVSGRSVTGLWTGTAPDPSLRWRGWGGMYGPGIATRPYNRRINPS